MKIRVTYVNLWFCWNPHCIHLTLFNNLRRSNFNSSCCSFEKWRIFQSNPSPTTSSSVIMPLAKDGITIFNHLWNKTKLLSPSCDPLQSFADTCWAEPTIVGQQMLWCHKPKSGMPQFRMPDLKHMPLLRVIKLTPRQWTINRSYEGQAGVDQGRRPEAAEAGSLSREAAEAGCRSREAAEARGRSREARISML